MTANGFVPTPAPITDWMVSVLFTEPPGPDDTVLLPGAGTGNFAKAIHRACSYRGHASPEIHAVETDATRAQKFADRFENADQPEIPAVPETSARQLDYSHPPSWSPDRNPVGLDITLDQTDFLLDPPDEQFDYIIANPPFVQYNDIDDDKRERYAKRYRSAEGRFNLYAPFVEQMTTLLSESQDMMVILPEDFLFSGNDTLRNWLRKETLHFIRPLPKATFPNHQVRTVAVSLTKSPSLGCESAFVVDTWPYKVDIKHLLRGLDVAQDRIDDTLEEYLDRFRSLQTRVRSRRRTKGSEGGYNSDNNQDSTENVQIDLNAFG